VVVRRRGVIVVGGGEGEGMVQGEEDIGDRDEFVGSLGVHDNGPGEGRGDDGEGGEGGTSCGLGERKEGGRAVVGEGGDGGWVEQEVKVDGGGE
jgi:hypothetical protein